MYIWRKVARHSEKVAKLATLETFHKTLFVYCCHLTGFSFCHMVKYKLSFQRQETSVYFMQEDTRMSQDVLIRTKCQISSPSYL